jgi:hypothetical protein
MLMCRACWSKVPYDLQADVYRTVTQRGRFIDKTWAPWWRAQARAIAFVFEARGGNPAPFLERELKFAALLDTRE